MTQVLKLPKKEVRQWNKVLRRKTPLKDCGPYEVLKTYTAKFEDGYEVDIKVCNGKGPFLDPVLFDDRGCEAATLQDCSDHLDGVYEFNTGHVLTVEVA